MSLDLTGQIIKKIFFCVISTPKYEYRLGETPEIEVEIVNNTKEDYYLIGSFGWLRTKMEKSLLLF